MTKRSPLLDALGDLEQKIESHETIPIGPAIQVFSEAFQTLMVNGTNSFIDERRATRQTLDLRGLLLELADKCRDDSKVSTGLAASKSMMDAYSGAIERSMATIALAGQMAHMADYFAEIVTAAGLTISPPAEAQVE